VGGVIDDRAVGRGRGRGEGDGPRLAGGHGAEVTGQQGTARDRVGRAGGRVGATHGPAGGRHGAGHRVSQGDVRGVAGPVVRRGDGVGGLVAGADGDLRRRLGDRDVGTVHGDLDRAGGVVAVVRALVRRADERRVLDAVAVGRGRAAARGEG